MLEWGEDIVTSWGTLTEKRRGRRRRVWLTLQECCSSSAPQASCLHLRSAPPTPSCSWPRPGWPPSARWSANWRENIFGIFNEISQRFPVWRQKQDKSPLTCPHEDCPGTVHISCRRWRTATCSPPGGWPGGRAGDRAGYGWKIFSQTDGVTGQDRRRQWLTINLYLQNSLILSRASVKSLAGRVRTSLM